MSFSCRRGRARPRPGLWGSPRWRPSVPFLLNIFLISRRLFVSRRWVGRLGLYILFGFPFWTNKIKTRPCATDKPLGRWEGPFDLIFSNGQPLFSFCLDFELVLHPADTGVAT
jgi:hypothetical protein